MAHTSRTTRFQIQTEAPIPQALEACWYAMIGFGVHNAVIDAQKNVVSGSTGMTLGSYGQTLKAQLESIGGTTIIRVSSEAQILGTVDFGASKRQAEKLGDAIEAALQRNQWSEPSGTSGGPVMLEKPIVPPIASPTASSHYNAAAHGNSPRYGVAGPVRRGNGILIYGLLSITCCNIAAPFALIYGIKTLNEYKLAGTHPGDRTIVMIGTILGGLGMVRLLYVLSQIAQMSFS